MGILVTLVPYRNPDTQYGSKGNQGTHEFALFKRGHLNLPGEIFHFGNAKREVGQIDGSIEVHEIKTTVFSPKQRKVDSFFRFETVGKQWNDHSCGRCDG